MRKPYRRAFEKNGTIHVPLTRGMTALVSRKDRTKVSPYKWFAQSTGCGFYAARRTTRRGRSVIVLLHRELLGLPKRRWGDHRNGNTLDNRRRNIRPATPAQNASNRGVRTGTRLGSTIGASYAPQLNKTNPWTAYISFRGKRLHLGYFSSEAAAIRARRIKAKQLYGAFAARA
jgi:hypothetical protein